jgi:hypothetical protein
MVYIIFDESNLFPSSGHVLIIENRKNKWYYIDFMCLINIRFQEINEKLAHKIISTQEHYIYEPQKNMVKIGSMTFISCISMIKLYLGINNRFIYTPEHLRLFLQGNPITLKDKLTRAITAIKYFFLIPR